MRHAHTTTGNPLTWVRVAVLALLAWSVAELVPYAGPGALDYIAPRAANLGILFSITVGFLMYKTLTRRTDMDGYIAVELNKIRRIFHLAMHLAKAEPKLAPWFGQIRGAVQRYLESFREHRFLRYEAGNPLFRSVTYAVYGLPATRLPYNMDLYNALLAATSQATEARENIRSKKADYIGRFPWIVVGTVALSFSAIIITSTPAIGHLRLVDAVVTFCSLLVLQLIWEEERDNSMEDRVMAERYLADLAAMEKAQSEY